MTKKMQPCRIIYYSLTALHVSSNIFAHHQEHLNCITVSGIKVSRCRPAATYVCNTRSCNTVQMLLIMSENIARNMQSSQGIINYPTRLHLVGHFRVLLTKSGSGLAVGQVKGKGSRGSLEYKAQARTLDFRVVCRRAQPFARHSITPYNVAGVQLEPHFRRRRKTTACLH